MSNVTEIDFSELEKAMGGAGENGESAPRCPVCGTTMQPSGVVVDGKPISGKWVCPECHYSVRK